MEIKKIRLGGILLPSNVLMAPLDGYTCYPFRMLAYEMGAGLCFTEMSSANALKYQDKATRRLLFTTAEEPVKAVQLLGGIPAVMEEMACGELLAGFDVIDINMGCPVPNVFKSGEGSALMLDQKRASAIIRGCKKSGKPVTVKCRTGIHENNMFTAEFARMCEASGADMITIHGRSRNMMYDGTPCYKEIAHAKAAVSIPVIANGDVFSPQDAVRILQYTGADMAMIGRGCFGNPWIFREAAAALEGKPIPAKPPLAERCDTAVRQIELAAAYNCENIALLTARRHYTWYLKGVPHGGYYKEQIVRMETLEDVYRVTKGIKRDLHDS